jgi:hypothetical protein
MFHPYRVSAGTKAKRAVKEVSIHGAHEWPSVSRRSGEDEESHPAKLAAQLFGRQASLVSNNSREVDSCAISARVEQPLQFIEFVGRFLHMDISAQPRPAEQGPTL